MGRKKKSGKLDMNKHALKLMKCSSCENEVRVDQSCVSVICPMCSCKLAGAAREYINKPKTKSEFPKGWRLYKQYVHTDGRVFEFGVENEQLKGTLKPTEIKVNTLSKTERRRLREEKQHRREIRLARQYEKKMKLLKKEEGSK